MKEKHNNHLETDIVHGVHFDKDESLSLAMPIYQTSTFKFKNAEHGSKLFKHEAEGYIYTRINNPNNEAFQEKVAILEGADAGVVTSSGLAASANIILALAKQGDSIVVDTCIYGGTHALLEQDIVDTGIEVIRVDTSDIKQLEKAVKPNTKLIWSETPANPNMKIIDIAEVAKYCKSKNIPFVVDNTFCSPYLQNPISLGADIVLHSCTKYLCGHGDVIGGVFVGKNAFIEKARKRAEHYGWCQSPFNSWLLLRGVKTLALRMEKHSENGMILANYLEKHPKVEKVYYPGLKSNPYHEIAKKQMKAFGGMIAFDVKGGYEAGKKLMDAVKLMVLAVSLGDCETLISHPASMTHSSMSEEDLKKGFINPGMVRISCGIENADDLIKDLDQALSKI